MRERRTPGVVLVRHGARAYHAARYGAARDGAPRRRVPPADERRPVLDRDVLVHVHGARAPLSGAALPVLPAEPAAWPRAARTSGTTRATSRGTAATPRTSGTCRCPTSRSPTSRCPTASATAASSRSAGTRSATTIPTTATSCTSISRSPRSRRRTTSAQSHLDQPGRYTGTHRARGRAIAVDSFGFRDRSWGPRSQFGQALTRRARAHTAATATPPRRSATPSTPSRWTSGNGCRSIHGYLLRDGEWSKLATAARGGRARPPTAIPTRVAIDGVDELGRELHAEGRCLNRLGVHHQPEPVHRATASPSGRSTASRRTARTTTTGARRPSAASCAGSAGRRARERHSTRALRAAFASSYARRTSPVRSRGGAVRRSPRIAHPW